MGYKVKRQNSQSVKLGRSSLLHGANQAKSGKASTLVLLASLSLLAFSGMGCAKKTDTIQPSTATTPAVDATDSRGTSLNFSYSGGATATFVPENMTVLATYVGNPHPLNQPTNFQINVNLSNVGRDYTNQNDVYGGTVQISYYDNSSWYNGYFTSGSGTVGTSLHYSGRNEADFNQWFGFNGQKVFHGFFQDKSGSIVLVVDESLANGDGGIANEVNGSVYFKNFNEQNCKFPPLGSNSCGQSALKCWFTENGGPFDCRAFLGSNGLVNTTSALNPGNGYTKLGRFSGLNYKSAFGL